MTTGQARAGARRRQDKGRETGRGWDGVGAAEHTRAGCRPPTLSHTNFKPHKCCVTSALHPRPSSPPLPPRNAPSSSPAPSSATQGLTRPPAARPPSPFPKSPSLSSQHTPLSPPRTSLPSRLPFLPSAAPHSYQPHAPSLSPFPSDRRVSLPLSSGLPHLPALSYLLLAITLSCLNDWKAPFITHKNNPLRCSSAERPRLPDLPAAFFSSLRLQPPPPASVSSLPRRRASSSAARKNTPASRDARAPRNSPRRPIDVALLVSRRRNRFGNKARASRRVTEGARTCRDVRYR